MSSDLTYKIEKMQRELADMKKQLKQQDKLELKGGDGYYLQTETKPLKWHSSNEKLPIQRGAFRCTKELAEIADKNMVTRNLLEAYVHYIQGDGEGIHSITQTGTGFFVRSIYNTGSPIGTVLMQEETAEILCEKLNTGEIEL